MIELFFENIAPLDISDDTLNWLRQSARAEERILKNISFIFCDDEYLLNINKEYLNHDYYTDIITFDYSKGKNISGDIFVSLQRITDNAGQVDTSFENELHRVMIHGILHLCGYKDKTSDEEALMRSKEDFYLNTRSN